MLPSLCHPLVCFWSVAATRTFGVREIRVITWLTVSVNVLLTCLGYIPVCVHYVCSVLTRMFLLLGYYPRCTYCIGSRHTNHAVVRILICRDGVAPQPSRQLFCSQHSTNACSLRRSIDRSGREFTALSCMYMPRH